MISHMESLELPKLASLDSQWNENDDDIKKQCNNRAFKDFIAYLLMENADQTKYGSLLTNIASQYSLGQNQYPTNLVDATNALSSHKLDAKYYESKKKRKENEKAQKQKSKENKQSNNEQVDEETDLSFAQMEGRCYCCGKPGHQSPQCRENNKPKSEWAINNTTTAKKVQHVMSQLEQKT